VPCAINQPLSFNLVDKSNDYYLGIVKAKFDLSAFTAPVGNALDKVLIQSQSFNVINSFYGNVLQNQIIMDVDYPQTSTDTVLYYQPNYLNTFTLSSALPINLIQMNLFVQLEDGTQQQLYLAPNKSWSCRLAFVRKY
jgi:hypothetical protein